MKSRMLCVVAGLMLGGFCVASARADDFGFAFRYSDDDYRYDRGYARAERISYRDYDGDCYRPRPVYHRTSRYYYDDCAPRVYRRTVVYRGPSYCPPPVYRTHYRSERYYGPRYDRGFGGGFRYGDRGRSFGGGFYYRD